ncbi:lipopolysaccharide export system permease protein [Chitinophaga costaii]|uniref:Lipopolysaccharide export system permease protein n=1 Tax=Chitinophaga costaii TaxID=1335309 RepID=A0A1C4F1Q4_9BACT|nr:LptF/LptG family permease [Chitinophaga costaii]PUZ22179.1 YjgP/YjgQ family permease [Chitinophaga costaii]SCC49898.1 lipopolysaccharide export system permease protein [Chitinophaga costaii]
MKKLDKLIIKTFFGPFVATFFVTLFVLIMQFLWKYIDDFVGKGLDTWVIIKLMAYTSASLVTLALPLAVLLSSIMTFGNLGESFELVALKSSGISLLRFMRPLLVLCVGIAVLAFLFANYAIPVANLQAKSLLYDVTNSKPAFNIKAGEFYSDIPGYTIKVAQKDPDNKTIHQVIIYDKHSAGGSDQVILAEKGIMGLSNDKQFLLFKLENGWRYEERYSRMGNTQPGDLIRLGFKEYTKAFDMSSFRFSQTDVNLFSSNQQMLNVKQLDVAVDSLDKQLQLYQKNVNAYVTTRYSFNKWKDTGWLKQAPLLKVAHFEDAIPVQQREYAWQHAAQSIRDTQMTLESTSKDYAEKFSNILLFKVEWQRKFTLAFACIVMFLIGAPLGSIIRKGGLGTPLVFAVIFFVIFNIFFMVGEKMARSNVLTTFSGMWLSNIVLFPIAVFLIYKALNDSQLFNKEFYYRLFRTLKRLLRHSPILLTVKPNKNKDA